MNLDRAFSAIKHRNTNLIKEAVAVTHTTATSKIVEHIDNKLKNTVILPKVALSIKAYYMEKNIRILKYKDGIVYFVYPFEEKVIIDELSKGHAPEYRKLSLKNLPRYVLYSLAIQIAY